MSQPPEQDHTYLSTACLHGHHDYCASPVVLRDGYSAPHGEAKEPARCKFCPARCVCDCHVGAGHPKDLQDPPPLY